MKRLKWITVVNAIWFLILVPAYVGLLALVKYWLDWEGITIVAAIMAIEAIRHGNLSLRCYREKRAGQASASSSSDA